MFSDVGTSVVDNNEYNCDFVILWMHVLNQLMLLLMLKRMDADYDLKTGPYFFMKKRCTSGPRLSPAKAVMLYASYCQ